MAVVKLTNKAVTSYVLRKLGHPTICVELDPTAIDEAIKAALEKYSERRPIERLGVVGIFDSIPTYNFTTLDLPFGAGLLDFMVPPITPPLSDFDIFYYHSIPPLIDITDYSLFLFYWDDVRQITSTRFDWEWDQEQTTLLVAPKPTRSYAGVYKYADPAAIDGVPQAWHLWIKQWALAEAKDMLSQIRTKFGNLPGNQVSPTLNGSDLASQADRLFEKLETDLDERTGDITPPLVE